MSSAGQNLNNRDYTVEIGQYFSRGWEIFKQYAWGFIGFAVVIFLVTAVASKLPAPLGVGISEEGESSGGGIVNGILSPVLGAGFYIVAFNIVKNRPKSFGDFFRGFNNFLQIFLVNLVGGLLTALGLVLLILPGIYLAVAYWFAILYVVEKRMGFWAALEASRKLITKKWFSFFGFGILLLLLNLGGVLACVVGLLVTIPLTHCIVVAAYEDIVGLNIRDTEV